MIIEGHEERAQSLLTATSLFDELGLEQLAAAARMTAHDTLELGEQLRAERSARRAIQARAERLEALLLARDVKAEPRLEPETRADA